jgi:hypothetical protein
MSSLFLIIEKGGVPEKDTEFQKIRNMLNTKIKKTKIPLNLIKDIDLKKLIPQNSENFDKTKYFENEIQNDFYKEIKNPQVIFEKYLKGI